MCVVFYLCKKVEWWVFGSEARRQGEGGTRPMGEFPGVIVREVKEELIVNCWDVLIEIGG